MSERREPGFNPELQNQELPELSLREVSKSPESIGKVLDIISWNDYSLVIPEQGKKVLIYDESGKRLSDFEAKAYLDVTFNLKRILLQKNIQMVTNRKLNSTHTEIGDLPLHLKKKLSERLSRLGYGSAFNVYVGDMASDQEVFSMARPKFTLIDGDRFVVIHDEVSEAIVVFETQKDGIPLSPNNWRRIDYTSIDEFPDEILSFMKLSRQEGHKEINAEYNAMITGVSFSILRKGQKEPVFTQRITGVNNNVIIDPNNPNFLYFSSTENPQELNFLDMSGEPDTWAIKTADYPKQYPEIKNLQLDPSGNFFLFHCKEDFVVMTRHTLQEVKRITGITNVNFDSEGRIRAVDSKGYLVVYQPEFDGLIEQMEKSRISRLNTGIRMADIFSPKKRKGSADSIENPELQEQLLELKDKYEREFEDLLAGASTLEDVDSISGGFSVLRETLRQNNLQPAEIDFVVEGLQANLEAKRREMSNLVAAQILDEVTHTLSGSISLTFIGQVNSDLERIKPFESSLDESLRQQLVVIRTQFAKKSMEYFALETERIIRDVQGVVTGAKTQLDAFVNKSEFDDWLEFGYPQLKATLADLLRSCPLEADKAFQAISTARNELQNLAETYKRKFEKEYAKIREKAAERTDTMFQALHDDISGLVGRLRDKGFKARIDAERYLQSSESRKALEAEILSLTAQDPDKAKELERLLKSELSMVMSEIERGSQVKVVESGQQMIMLGSVLFPKWEARVKEKREKRAELTFIADDGTRGPGIRASQVLGDVGLIITHSDGKEEAVRLWQNLEGAEDSFRYGYASKKISESYMTKEEYDKFFVVYKDWSRGDRSKIREEYLQRQSASKEAWRAYQLSGEYGRGKTDTRDVNLKAEAERLTREFINFYQENQIALLLQTDRMKNSPESVHENGKGFVPEWQAHWVADPQTEKYLEQMAILLKMQLDLHEGVLNLKGHAGTGKDVLVKMLCARTGRPYFATDCTKWTTEFELAEDVVLEAKDGATQTIKVPSAVLNGITTPGAVVYFNEINGMPEQAQIFLHALFDEKRSLTLKTSSGRVVKADSSVLLVSSMNPGYPGTFDPQFATKSRMVSLDVDYPPLLRERIDGDTNPNFAYNPSEALRVAREVDSLSEMTYEASMDRNEFVRLWEHYINRVDNGSAEPTAAQKFDLETIAALLQFGDILRRDFTLNFEKSRDARTALPVKQPLTGRELRRAAYALNQIPEAEKVNGDPEKTARDLLDKFFLSHIYETADRDKIRTALKSKSFQRRVKA